MRCIGGSGGSIVPLLIAFNSSVLSPAALLPALDGGGFVPLLIASNSSVTSPGALLPALDGGVIVGFCCLLFSNSASSFAFNEP